MSSMQPLNAYDDKYGEPIHGMVLISASASPSRRQLLAGFRTKVTYQGDLRLALRKVRRVRELTEALIAEGRSGSHEEVESAHDAWTIAVVAYGRCFINADGRRPLSADDVPRLQGDPTCHGLLMEHRHGSAAHVTLDQRRIEVFAVLGDGPDPAVTNLAVIESYTPLPDVENLRQIELHIAALERSLYAELITAQARVARRLDDGHRDELRECLRTRSAWL